MHLSPSLTEVMDQTKVKLIGTGRVVESRGSLKGTHMLGRKTNSDVPSFSRNVTFPLMPTVAIKGTTTL